MNAPALLAYLTTGFLLTLWRARWLSGKTNGCCTFDLVSMIAILCPPAGALAWLVGAVFSKIGER